MRFVRCFFLISCLLLPACGIVFMSPTAYANNAAVSNVALGTRYGNDGYMDIQFDLSWNNSWRNSVSRDAVWVFAKFQTTSGGAWSHCTLKVITPDSSGYTSDPTNYTVGTEAAGQTPRILVPSDNRGCFIERAGSGYGNMSITGIKILWDWATDGLTATSTINQIKVFAVEMTYISQGSFYVGDGATSTLLGHFEAETTGTPLQITSEGQLTLGGGGAGSLGNNNAAGMYTADDFNDATTKTLPAAFPKGYNAFYLMKYEMSEGQYTDFLNVLTRTQQNKRVGSNITGDAPTSASIYVMSSTASVSSRQYLLCPSSGNGTTNPITFSTARADRAHNWVCWMDLVAFADWAGLRPITELEYEKACRGPNASVVGEFSWGNSTISAALTISGTEDGTETISTSGANCNYNTSGFAGGDTGNGPLRCGIFATATSTRAQAGAGYYGNMELTGNTTERTVSVGTSNGRSFTGTHGDGVLTTTSGYEGNATNTDWPGIDATPARGVTGSLGAGVRGGSAFNATYNTVSLRYEATRDYPTRRYEYGGRCARSGPTT